MKLTRLVGECQDGSCPTIYATDRGTLAVQGSRISAHGLEIPSHKTLVEISVELIRKAARDHIA
ncbi:hypothetical protein ACH4TU_12090 [Streptomyces physcomitrii]|uniref:hypothetical protein n=1 Tax=Streptomyces physcomitrii TaxID=2724184 RepID=UPI00099C1296